MPDSLTMARPFTERVEEEAAGPCHLYTLLAPVDDVVSFAGSIQTIPDFSSGGALLQDLTVLLLDKGTKKRDRFMIADLIDNRGAQLRFRSNSTRIGFSGRAMPRDLEDVLTLLAEQLREPLFERSEFDKAKARLRAEIQRSMEETGAQAVSALTRQIYRPEHPNYQFTPEAELEALTAITLDDVVAFHERHVGARELTLVLVGDVGGFPGAALLGDVFSGWDLPEASGHFDPHGILPEPERVAVPVADKQNVDVRMGHALRLRRDDDGYLPLFLGNFVLGGNFSARLMSIIRDRLGLTYGINASLAGMSTQFDGYWRSAVTLAPANVDRGINATIDEVRRLVEEGVTQDEVDAVKTTIKGSFVVDLATTGGLAFSILVNVLRGFGIRYLDEFPSRIDAVTREEIDEALRRHLRPDAIQIAVAGSF